MNRLVLLGTKGGPAVRAHGAMPTASYLALAGRHMVVDCGLGVTKGLVDAGVDLKTLDHIFITHLHSDHVLELGPLLHTAWTTGLSRPVMVWGPDGITDYWAGFMAAMAFDNSIRVADEHRPPLESLIDLRTYGEGDLLAEDGLSVSALRVAHPPVTETYALRFDAGASVTFSSDTCFFPPLGLFATGTDVLVHEAMLPEGIEAIIAKTGLGDALRKHLHAAHSTVEDAARIAAAADAGCLVLHHLIPVDDPRFGPDDWLGRAAKIWNGKVVVAHDGLQLELKDSACR